MDPVTFAVPSLVIFFIVRALSGGDFFPRTLSISLFGIFQL